MRFPGIQGQGKLGNSVFQRTVNGTIQRLRVKPTQPKTPSQLAQRQLVRSVSVAWALPTTNRDNWIAYAAANPVTTKKGNVANITGQAFFMKINLASLSQGGDMIGDPSSVRGYDTGGPSGGVAPTANIEVTAGVITASDTLPTTPVENQSIGIYATAPMAPGRTNPPSGFRLIAVLTTHSLTGTDLTSAYVATWGPLTFVDPYHIQFKARTLLTGKEIALNKQDRTIAN